MMMVVEDDVDVDQIHVDQRLFSPLSLSTTKSSTYSRTGTIDESPQLLKRPRS